MLQLLQGLGGRVQLWPQAARVRLLPAAVRHKVLLPIRWGCLCSMTYPTAHSLPWHAGNQSELLGVSAWLVYHARSCTAAAVGPEVHSGHGVRHEFPLELVNKLCPVVLHGLRDALIGYQVP